MSIAYLFDENPRGCFGGLSRRSGRRDAICSLLHARSNSERAAPSASQLKKWQMRTKSSLLWQTERNHRTVGSAGKLTSVVYLRCSQSKLVGSDILNFDVVEDNYTPVCHRYNKKPFVNQITAHFDCRKTLSFCCSRNGANCRTISGAGYGNKNFITSSSLCWEIVCNTYVALFRFP